MSSKMQSCHGLETWLSHNSAAERQETAGIVVTIRAPLCHYNLRGDAADAEFLAAATSQLGQALPLVANTVASNGDQNIFWLGPDEWLIVTSDEVDVETATLLNLNELSGGQILLKITGDASEALLSKGCTLDLSAAALPLGSCAQTGLAKASVLVARADESSGFEIIVRRSFAEYLFAWLNNAGGEFGVCFSDHRSG